ncbi:hypothetical protein ASE86_14445 [Sphingomonas sp. Leaf33]|nr:hypothetical protein ASE86_14445 [Sphingomonas sp. Leaf33]
MAESFDPVLSNLLAQDVLGCAAAVEHAIAGQTTAEAGRDRSADGWRREDARNAALEAEAAIALRRMRRHADERLLASFADRETFRRAVR